MKNAVFWNVMLCGSVIAKQYNIPEDGILHSHPRENLKSQFLLIPESFQKFLLLGKN
jgi:hypothetical protein